MKIFKRPRGRAQLDTTTGTPGFIRQRYAPFACLPDKSSVSRGHGTVPVWWCQVAVRVEAGHWHSR
jgi:hypothetical protein